MAHGGPLSSPAVTIPNRRNTPHSLGISHGCTPHIVRPKEIEAVRLTSTRTIDIEQFVEASDIDRIYWDSPYYYLVPQGDEETRAYGVIQAAIAGSEKIALGRLVMHNREPIVAIEPRGSGLPLTNLRAAA